MSTFGQRLQEARKAAKLSQTVVAKRVGMSQSLLSELENDEYPTSGFTPRLAHLYKVTARWLADGVGPREISDAEALEDPEVLDLWIKYSSADAATKGLIECLLSGRRPKWMSPALADMITTAQRLSREQVDAASKSP